MNMHISNKFKEVIELINNQISNVHVKQMKHEVHSDEYKTFLKDESALLKIKLVVTELLINQTASNNN